MQVLIYIGAIVILFLFGIMLTRAPMRSEGEPRQQPAHRVRGGRALFLFGVLTALLVDAFGGKEIKLDDKLRRDRAAPSNVGDRASSATTSCRSRSSRCSSSPRWSAPS